jgi:hypothetical protein
MALAQELEKEFRSGRFLIHGDTGIADSSGSDATFYNPAGLAQKEGIFSELVVASPQVIASPHIQDVTSQIKEKRNVFDILSDNSGKVFHAGLQNFTGVFFKRAGIGILTQGGIDFYIGNEPSSGMPLIKGHFVDRTGFYGTYAGNPFSNGLFTGLTLKYLEKKQGSLEISALDAESSLNGKNLDSLFQDSFKQGAGIGADLGIMYEFKRKNPIRLGVVARNLGMSYRWVPPNTKPPKPEPTVIDAGFVYETGTTKNTLKLSADFRDLANQQNAHIYKHINLGAELVVLKFLGLGFGFYQGYLSYGSFLDFKIIKFEIGLYGEELGKIPGDIKGDRLFARLIVGWLL